MPRTCSICTHGERAAIDAALVAGEPFRNIAQRFATSPDATYRHRSHIADALAEAEQAGAAVDEARAATLARQQAAQDVAEARRAIDVVTQLKAINAATWEVLQQARAEGKGMLRLSAIDRVTKQIELQAKLLGELQQEGAVNITINPQWVSIRAVLFSALAPYPEARAAVAQALLEVDKP